MRLYVLLLTLCIGLITACTNVQDTVDNDWGNGRTGKLNFDVPVETTNSWELIVTFDDDVSEFNFYQGIVTRLADNQFKVVNQHWNEDLANGQSFETGYLLRYDADDFPEVTGFEFEGVQLCEGGGNTEEGSGNEGSSGSGNEGSTGSGNEGSSGSENEGSSEGSAENCEDLYTWNGDGWANGRDGQFNLVFPVDVDGWTVTVTFDKPLTTLNCYNFVCTSLGDGYSFTMENLSYNQVKSAGETITGNFQINHDASSQWAEISQIEFDGSSLCSSSESSTEGSGSTTEGAGSGSSTEGSGSGSSTEGSSSSTEGSGSTTESSGSSTEGSGSSTEGSGSSTEGSGSGSCSNEEYDYSLVIEKSLLFYEAQRSGTLPEDNRIDWRVSAMEDDQGDNGEDLSGGYFDAGDYVKFNFPMAGAMTVLSWGGIDFESGYQMAGQLEYLREAVKWGTDYFIKCYIGPEEIYAQVGDGDEDHKYWERPEEMTIARPALKLTPSAPGSDLAAEVAAALASASILFKDSDSSYSATLLDYAEKYFVFAETYSGFYSTSLGQDQFYKSYGYNDELSWAAAWLYKATDDASYLTKSQSYYDYAYWSGVEQYSFSWENKLPGVQVLLSEITGESQYIDDLSTFCSHARNNIARSPQGQLFYSEWGSLRYAANAALICLKASELNIDSSDNYDLAIQQLHYILGSTGRSFVVGFGEDYPLRPHHSASDCPTPPEQCGWNFYNQDRDNTFLVQGALVGGPYNDQDDYVDDRTNFNTNEVTLDYNAGFQSLLAGIKMKVCSS